MDIDQPSSVEIVQPAFNFDIVLERLQSSSKADKTYFSSVLKPKYGKKKAKLSKEKATDDDED